MLQLLCVHWLQSVGSAGAAAAPQSCTELVPSPVDVTPIRSPQAVHSAILHHVAGKSLVEIGTRNGDGMSCFAQVTRSATAVELSRPYCERPQKRSEALLQAKGASFAVACEDYRVAKGLDADIFTWWQEPPHLHNFAVLDSLHRLVGSGQVRASAMAILIFDQGFYLDRRDWRRLTQVVNWTSWTQEVKVNETAACRRGPREAQKWCERATGTFNIAGVPLANVGGGRSSPRRGRAAGARPRSHSAPPKAKHNSRSKSMRR